MIRTIVWKTALVLFGVGTVVAAVEIFGRVLPVDSLPAPLSTVVAAMRLYSNGFYQRDAYFRYTIRANADLLIQHPDFIYHVKTRLNLGQAGFRGGTEDGPIWGIAVGDSFTFGMGVEQESTWVARLANLMHQEIINLGVPGWGPQQYTRAIERYGVSLKPKVFFYGIYRNDLQDALLFDQWLRDPNYKREIYSFLGATSIIFNVLRLMWTDSLAGTENFSFDGTEVKFDPGQLKLQLIAEHNSFDASWAIMKPEIVRAVKYSQSAGAKFVLLYLPSKLDAGWELIRRKEPSLKSFDGNVAIFRSRLEEFCQTLQILCLDLTPVFRTRMSQGTKLYFTHDSHLTESGNRIVAEEIRNFLIAKGV